MEFIYALIDELPPFLLGLAVLLVVLVIIFGTGFDRK